MPGHKSHRYADKLMLGKSYREVHRAIDRPYLVLGRRHRVMFHTFAEAYLMGRMASDDPEAGLAGCFHVWLDEMCSKDKFFRKWLNSAATFDHRQEQQLLRLRKLSRKRWRKEATPLARLLAITKQKKELSIET